VQYKKEMFLNKCILGEKYDFKKISREYVHEFDKATLRKNFLEKLQSKITNFNRNKGSIKIDGKGEKTTEELVQYLEWFSTEGIKQYEVRPLSINNFKYAAYRV
jgi:hypothetical protein